jgi:hypothetical protein
VWRRLNRQDFTGSNPLLKEKKEHLYEFAWYRYGSGYELVEGNGEEPYFDAVRLDDANDVDSYLPLIETPYLFLDFAKLQERKDVDAAIEDWINTQGLLGLHIYEPRSFSRDEAPLIMNSAGECAAEGGPGETLAKVRVEVEVANRVLKLYEAALSGEVDKLEQALQIGGVESEVRRQREHYRDMAKMDGITYIEALIDTVMGSVFYDVQQVLEAFTYPCLAQNSSSTRHPLFDPWTPERITSSLRPRNLLGAMYLQCFWLIESASKLSHCKYCGRSISDAPLPGSGKRKPPNHKEYCDKRCRQNYHYHNVTKPSRQST